MNMLLIYYNLQWSTRWSAKFDASLASLPVETVYLELVAGLSCELLWFTVHLLWVDPGFTMIY